MGCELYDELQFDLLDRVASGVVVLDRAAHVMFANRAAQTLAAEDGPLRLRHGALSAASPAQARQLAALIRAALLGAPLATMSVTSPVDGRRVAVQVSPVRGRDRDRLAAFRLRDPAVLVFLSDPAAAPDLPERRLIDVYGLTATEARVALAVAAGGALADAAAQLAISLNTAKTHLARIFAKTGTRRQAEVARLVTVLAQVREP